MRVFFITHTYSIGGSGGGEQFVSNFLQEARRKGHEFLVFATTADSWRNENMQQNIGGETIHTLVLTPTHRLVREKLYIGDHTEITQTLWKKRPQ